MVTKLQMDGTTVLNVIEVDDGVTEWDGFPLLDPPTEPAGPGDDYDGTTVTQKPAPPLTPGEQRVIAAADAINNASTVTLPQLIKYVKAKHPEDFPE